MSDQKERLKKVIAYQDNELSTEEKKAFEKALVTDKALADIWQLNQEVDRAIDNPKALEMEALLQNIGNEFAQKHVEVPSKKDILTKTKIRPLYQLAIAASFALLVGIGWWQWQQSSPIDAQALYATAYEPYITSNINRSTNPTAISILKEAQTHYQAGDYETTIQQLSTFLGNENLAEADIITAQFYKGLAHLGNNQFSIAQAELKAVLKTNGHVYTQQAQWYLALIALKNGNIVQTKDWLNQVITTAATGKYAKKAKALLAQLK